MQTTWPLIEKTHSGMKRTLSMLAQRPTWKRDTVLLSVVLSLFLSFPAPSLFARLSRDPEARAFVEKSRHPFTPLDVSSGSHESKMDFRIVPPLIAHILHLGPIGAKGLEAMSGVLLLAMALLLAYRITEDRRFSILACFYTAVVFAGTTSFIEFRCMFDGLAIALLLCAMYFRNGFAVGLFVTAAAWTDERAFIASGFVWVLHAHGNLGSLKELFVFHKKILPWVIYFVWAGYFAGRWALVEYCHFRVDTGNIGLGVLASQLNNVALGLWSAFEGGWIVVLCAVLVLILNRKWMRLVFFLMAFMPVFLVGFAVMDITRSLAYALPAFFICLNICREYEAHPTMNIYLGAAFLLSALWPSIYAGGIDGAWWFSPPVFVQAIQYIVYFAGGGFSS